MSDIAKMIAIAKKFGGGASGSAGGGIMYVNVTSIGELTPDDAGGMYGEVTLDKSFEEIQSAYDAGGFILCRENGLLGGTCTIIPLSGVDHDHDISFAAHINGASISISITPTELGYIQLYVQ